MYQDSESSILDAIVNIKDNELAQLDRIDMEPNIVNAEQVDESFN